MVTFLDEIKNKHIVISYVTSGVGLKRKISTGKMYKKLD
jgi:hypothetical protein